MALHPTAAPAPLTPSGTGHHVQDVFPLVRPVKTLGQATVLPALTLMLRQRLLEPVHVWTGTMGLRILVLSAQVRVKHAVVVELLAVCCVSIMLRRTELERVCATRDIGLI